jgi:amino acid adenylation domain-containing protein
VLKSVRAITTIQIQAPDILSLLFTLPNNDICLLKAKSIMPERLSILNDPARTLDGPQLLHQLIQWDNKRDLCAIDFSGKYHRQQYSYIDLQSCVAGLTSEILKSLEARKESGSEASQTIIPILVPQCPGLYIAQLAILTSGAAFCPINLDAPEERIKFVVDDVEADIIITTSEFRHAASWEGGPIVILVDEFPKRPSSQSPCQLPLNVSPESLAYVMYTSGSSGTPKGVAVSHLAVSQSLLSHEKHIPRFRRFLQFASPSFDVSIFEIFFPLVRGCTLVGCDRTQLLNNLPGTIVDLNIDAAELTPTVVGSLLQKRANAPCLKLLLTIGEMLTWPIVEEFGSSDTQDVMLYAMYGPTEAAIHCTIFPAMRAITKPGNIGFPLDTVSTFIAKPSSPTVSDDVMTILPVGELGELVLGGVQLAKTYLNREDQNKLAFVRVDGRTYYRTGDIARQLEDGTIEIRGRISAGQVKLRGQRIELGEIEEVIYRHTGLKTAVAVVINGTLIVFALVGDSAPSTRDMHATCAKWLPKFMIPSEIILKQKFPYLPSGKVDKRQLEADYKKELEAEDLDNISPNNVTGSLVKSILHEFLSSFSSKSRLAAAGLDSLVAIRIATRLRSEGFGISTIAVLQAETMSNLIYLCENSTPISDQMVVSSNVSITERVVPALNGNAKDVQSIWPCTPLQSAMLAETLIDSRAYKNWVELQVSSRHSIDQVCSAIYDLAKHNAILRTGFAQAPESDGFVQVIWTSLADYQIETVKEFEYDEGAKLHDSFHHPVRFQVMDCKTELKLLMHIHHALYDAWSLELLLDDFETVLNGCRVTERPPFTNLVQGYQSGILATNDWPSTQYWKDHLAFLEPTLLPNFHTTRTSSARLRVEEYCSSISTADVEATAKKLCCSPQSIFQAAYAIMLSSYLGSSDVCFGTVFSGRTLPIPGIEDIVGPCLSTLPVRTEVSLSRSIGELVADLNSINRSHLEHSTKPLRDIKSACGIRPGKRLFDTLVIWQQTLHPYDHKWKHVALVNIVDSLEYDLTLEIVPGVGNVLLRANYKQSIFPKAQINYLLQQVEALTSVLLKNPEMPINQVLHHIDERLLSIENPEPFIKLKGETLSSTVEKVALEDPERPAIDFATAIDSGDEAIESITYAALNAKANQRADYLISSGLSVQPDDLVCICMEKSVELYVSILATAKTGVGYLPLTPDTPEERLRYVLQEAKVEVVLTQSNMRHLFKHVQAMKVVYVDEVDFSGFSELNKPPRSHPEHISYCVFTSGSTGTPKGVLVTQGNLLSNLDVLEDLYPTGNNIRLLQSCSQAFDVSVFEIFFTWRVGGCICAAIKDVIFRDIEQAINLLEVTHLSLTPTVAALVNPASVPNVKFLVTAGEAVTQKVFNSWADRGLFQGYGPSETTNICTVNPHVTKNDFINNIGRPFDNTSAFILSPGDDFLPVPRGGEGEFCFGGSQVFRGYMNSDQEVGNIIEHSQFGRLYRSGDFGRLLPDGSLAFSGRKDDQVKIRGQRIELGEINSVMLRCAGVRDCYTMVYHVDNDSRLIGFWTNNDDGLGPTIPVPPNVEIISELFRKLELVLPAYMIPSSLVQISHLPPTAQGKIDRRFLVKLYASLEIEYLTQVSQAPRKQSEHEWNDLEAGIAKAVSEVAKIPLDQISPDTSFFALGIDSISAISLARLLRSNKQCQVEISQILKNPSVMRLATVISSSYTANAPASTQDGESKFDQRFLDFISDDFHSAGKTVRKVLPCTPLQEAMLSATEASSGSLYSNDVVMRIHGDVSKLRNCWQKMVDRHDILRTCFVATDLPQYPYVQVVLQEYKLIFRSDDHRLDSLPIFSHQPPYSIKMVESRNQTLLQISMHHALYDGVALDILYGEVEQVYRGENLLPPVSFAPFLYNLTSPTPESSDNFWSSVLKGVHPLRAFAQKKEQAAPAPHTQSIKVRFPFSWMESNIRKNGTSLLAVCHSAWAGVLSERTQTSDLLFGTIVSGRTAPVYGIERLVAPCFNTISARLQNVHKLSHLEAFRKFQALSADSLPFQFTPLRRIQSRFSPDGSRLFDTLFILQKPVRDLDSSIWSLCEDSGVMDFPVVCEVIPKHSEDTLEVILHSDRSILLPEESLDILKEFEDRLHTSLTHPRQQMLSSSVKEQIFVKSTARLVDHTETEDDIIASQPTTTDEDVIRDILAGFTNVSRSKISKDITIFRLGLDSISAVQVANRLTKLGHSVMASDVLEHPTIAQLALHISQLSKSSQTTSNYDFQTFDRQHRARLCLNYNMNADTIEAVRPCTAVQSGMIAQSIHSAGREYINSISMELDVAIGIPELRFAWAEVCRIHEMLRTGFVTTNDSKTPFAMITIFNDSFQIPFDNGKEPIERIMQDLRRPWRLSIETKTDRIMMTLIFHHAIFDAQSMKMILDDLAISLGSEQMSNRPSVEHLLGAILVNSEQDDHSRQAFWKRNENKLMVNKFPDLTPLNVSDATSAVSNITSQRSVLDLETACKEKGVTMQAAGQVAWARLLAAYIGEASTTFGLILSGRSIHEEADRISFPSIVTLPVRCDVTGTNSELLARTMELNARLHKHQFTPLASIQKWAGYPEGKIFDTLFAYQKTPTPEDVTTVPWKVVREEASVDYVISLELQPLSTGKLAMRLTFREDLVPIEHAAIMLRQYDALLLDVLQNPQNACDIALTREFGADLLSITPPKEYQIPSEITLLHQFLERGARQWPEKTAFEFASSLDSENFKTHIWSYAEVEEQANKVANVLVQKNVQPGEIIAISFDKCPEASFAIIGIMKAGCAYVALDPNAPIDRVKFILEDSGAILVLTAGKIAQVLIENLEQEVIKLDEPGVCDKQSSNKPTLSRDVTFEDVSYCLYTSGTTGTPKGCLITHENAVQAMLSFQRLFAGHWTPDSKWLQFASFHFDVSVLEQFWSWSVGICVASAPRDLIFEDIPGTIRQLGITHIDLTPSLARLLHPDDVPSLWKGVFITGGEQLRQEILDVWGDKACIYNGYGPTEATIGVTMYPRVPRNGKPSNIGPQFNNVGSFVLKPGTTIPVLRGGIGELCVSGKLVGKGYLNRPDLTAERFPTLMEFGERIYRTGDLVRILYDGTFIFLGRADDQVKLRGQRLELSEINEVIKKAVSNLTDVVTLVLKHSTQQKEQLVTFFVAIAKPHSKDPSGMISEMKNGCKSRLPGYMVPTHFIPVKELPLNANNKADSKQLAAMYNDLGVDELQQLSRSDTEIQPWNVSENRIVKIIAAAMSLEALSVTRNSSIFELGLDSISIIGFSRALQDVGLENARLSTVKNNPNVGALVAALSSKSTLDENHYGAYVEAKQNIAAFSQKHMVGVCQELDVEAKFVECVAPCTPVQEGMIFRFMENEDALYFNKFSFRIDESVDVEKLWKAWESVIKYAQVLRTKFVATDDGFAQVVLEDSEFCWGEEITRYAEMDKLKALRRPYHITLEQHKEQSVMTLQMFHGLYDGTSLAILLERVAEELRGIPNIDYGPPFQQSLPYGSLVSTNGAKAFWTEHLKDWSPRTLPLEPYSQQDLMVKRSITSLFGFEELRKSLGVTPQAVMQAAWVSVLQTLIPDPTIGLVTSGRSFDFENADKIIGPLFNTVPFHCVVSSARNFADLIYKCHKFNMQMQDYQHTPLKDVQKWSPAQQGMALFESLFVFQRGGDEDFARGLWEQIEDEEVIADYPLAFEATMSSGGNSFDLVIVGQGGFVTRDKAEELLMLVEKALQNIVSSKGTTAIADNYVAIGSASPMVSTKTTTQSQERNANFQWTNQASLIRSEIAQLARVSVELISEHSSIFELGLDSIDVIRLSSRLKKKGINIPVSVVMKSHNIAQMSLNIIITSSKSDASSTNILKGLSDKLEAYLRKVGKLLKGAGTVLPTTPLQQSMVNEMIRSDYERYFNIDVLKIDEGVDIDKLIDSVKKAIKDSPILGATFFEVEDPDLPFSYAQIIPDKSEIVPYTVDLTENEKYGDLNKFMSSLKAECTTKAKENEELFQIHFVHTATADYFVMAAAHALYDGTSMRLLHENIKAAFNNEPITRPDFMPFLEEVFSSTTDEAKRFWRTTLLDVPSTVIPRKESPSSQEVVHRMQRFSEVPLNLMEQLSMSSRITFQTIAQTTYSLVLAHLTKQLDVLFGSVISCRDTEEANAVQFPLMNTVAVRSILHSTLSDMLAHMQGLSDSTRQYQHFPLGTAQAYALASRQDNGDKGAKLVDTLFIYQGRRQSEEETLYRSVQGTSEVEFPICVEMEIVDGKIVWTIACKSSVCDEHDTTTILEALDEVLGRLVQEKNMQTIVSNADGVSICGLPPFESQKSNTKENSALQKSPAEHETEWSETEIKIRGALYELSGVSEDTIHKDSTIFHLGLDSILVLKLPALFRKVGVHLSVSDILRELTVEAMAKLVGSSNPQKVEIIDVEKIITDTVSMIKSQGTREDLQLMDKIEDVEYVMSVTAGQLHMIRQWQASKGRLFYPTFTYRISGVLDKAALEEAWKQLCQRHAILRTGFVEIGDNILQIVLRNHDNSVRYDRSELLSDLSIPPLSLMVAKHEDITLLKLHIHHALYDGISLPILHDELHSLYLKLSIPPPRVGFKHFIASSISSSATTETSWISYLKTAPPSKASYPRHSNRTEIYHPALRIASLKVQTKRLGISIDTLLLASAAKQYASHTQNPSSNLIIGIYLANRAPFGEDLSNLPAPTLNLLPLLIVRPLNTPLSHLAQEIQKDITKISNANMVSASLAEIYAWTGVKVDFFVNVVKSPAQIARDDKEVVFESLDGTGDDSREVEVHPDHTFPEVDERKIEAYPVSSCPILFELLLGDM